MKIILENSDPEEYNTCLVSRAEIEFKDSFDHLCYALERLIRIINCRTFESIVASMVIDSNFETLPRQLWQALCYPEDRAEFLEMLNAEFKLYDAEHASKLATCSNSEPVPLNNSDSQVT